MNDSDTVVLFDALGKILYNQDKLLKHLGINKHDSDYGYDDDIEVMAKKCYAVVSNYERDF